MLPADAQRDARRAKTPPTRDLTRNAPPRTTTQATRRLIPLLDRVLVQRLEPPTKSLGGVLLPESSQSKLNEGVVVATGPGRRDKDGSLIPMGVKSDDKVLLPQYGGNEVTIEDEAGAALAARERERLCVCVCARAHGR